MSDDQQDRINPYAASATTDFSINVDTISRGTYGGIGRLAYVGYTFLAFLIYYLVVFGVAAAGNVVPGNEAAFILVLPLMLVYYGVLLWIVAQRMINAGYSPWWCLGLIVPIVNLLVWIRCIACPEGYADHRTLDTAGKIIVGLCLAMFLLVILAIVFTGLG